MADINVDALAQALGNALFNAGGNIDRMNARPTTHHALREWLRAYIDATPPAGAGEAVAALEVFRIAGGDVECNPAPSAADALECLRDLRACYDERAAPTPLPEAVRELIEVWRERATRKAFSRASEDFRAGLNEAYDTCADELDRALTAQRTEYDCASQQDREQLRTSAGTRALTGGDKQGEEV